MHINYNKMEITLFIFKATKFQILTVKNSPEQSSQHRVDLGSGSQGNLRKTSLLKIIYFLYKCNSTLVHSHTRVILNFNPNKSSTLTLIYGFYSAPYLCLTYSKRNYQRLTEGQIQFINIRNRPGTK